MLRITSLSLLLGLAMLVAALAMLSPAPNETDNKALSIVPSLAIESTPDAHTIDADGSLRLSDQGDGVAEVSFELPGKLQAKDYPFLHLSIVEPRAKHDLTLVWTRTDKPAPTQFKIENLERESLWISTRELPGWQGEISKLGLRFTSMQPDEVYAVQDFALHPSDLSHWFGALIDDWFAYEYWELVSINSYTGVTQASSFYRTPISAALVALSLLSYIVLVLLSRKRARFSWYPPGLIVLSCWLLMDLGWQHRLLLQLADTRAQFSGLSSHERVREGPDAELVAFVDLLQPHITPRARVFVTSKNGYKGLRTAYHLYPHNVYWHRYAGLPPVTVYRRGDLIATVEAPHVKFNSENSTLSYEGRGPVSVDVLLRRRTGNLYRVR